MAAPLKPEFLTVPDFVGIVRWIGKSGAVPSKYLERLAFDKTSPALWRDQSEKWFGRHDVMAVLSIDESAPVRIG